MPFFNYDQKRLHYVRWVAPPYANIPSQYYNWSVGVPGDLEKGAALELNLHRDGRSFWRTPYRIEPGSIVICPHDFPVKTWWYGYHEAHGTLRSFKDGSVVPYTERRLLAFIEWACDKWPVDRNRIIVTGCKGGASGSGALHLGLRHPKTFCLVVSGHGGIDYARTARRTDRRGLGAAQSMHAIWGKPDWGLTTPDGHNVYELHNMIRLVKELPASADSPFVTLTAGRESAHPLYEAMLAKRRPIIGYFAWGGTRYMPVSMTATYPNAIRLDIARNKAMLAFVSPKGPKASYDGRQLNREYRWSNVDDRADRFAVTLHCEDNKMVDVTVRRTQKFTLTKGRAYAWKKGEQAGQVRAEADGMLTIPSLKFGGDNRLIITKQ
jgi:hypothetical protein